MTRYLLIVFVFILIFGCKKNQQVKTESNIARIDSTSIKIDDINKLNYVDFVLDSKSKNKISEWIMYDDLNEKIEELKKADLSYFKSDKEVVETLIEEFTTTIPENINTDDVNARALIVQNMYLKLNGTINLSTSEKEEIVIAIKDLLESFSNLNYQINKKFERDSQNIVKPES